MENEVDMADSDRSITMSGDPASNQIEASSTSATEMHLDSKDQDHATETTMSGTETPPLTHALEALLGGLEPLIPISEEPKAVSANTKNAVADTDMEGKPELKFEAGDDQPLVNPNIACVENKTQEVNMDSKELLLEEKREGIENTEVIMADVDTQPDEVLLKAAIKQDIFALGAQIPGLTMNNETSTGEHPPVKIENAELLLAPVGESPVKVENAELLLGSNASAVPGSQDVAEGEHPEWEVDSSPIESSSDDSSDSSDDESDDGDNDDLLLTAEQQARILMEGDGGSDDEGGKSKSAGGPLRTANELPDVVIRKPDVIITPDMAIKALGAVETVVDNTLLIKANTSGDYKVLESGSVLCLEDRTVFGAVADTIGRVQQPFYSVMFTNAAELQAANLPVGTKVFYTNKYATFIFTQALKAYKGSDASNIHDEEVGDEEVEFSDDEAEAEHRKKLKQKRAERRSGKAHQNGGPNRGGHPLQQSHQPRDASQGMNYDDGDDDGPYKPLARPVGYADSIGRGEAPQEGYPNGQERPRSSKGEFRDRRRSGDRGRGDRGRGDRGRGRGDRGRGRGGFQERRTDGHSLPPRPPQNFAQTPIASTSAAPFPQMPGFPNFFMPQTMQPNMPQYSPTQPQVGWPPFQQPFQNMQNMQSWPVAPPILPAAQNGAYFNPAFFPNGQSEGSPPQWYQQNNQNQNGRGRGRGQ